MERQIEFKGRTDKKARLIDLVFRRIDPERPEALSYEIGPIELKRARRYRADLATGQATPARGDCVRSVRRDIEKLASFTLASREGLLEKPDLSRLVVGDGKDKLHPHLLVWGRSNDDADVAQHPKKFMAAAFSGNQYGATMKDLHFDWIPTSWSEPVEKYDLEIERPPAVLQWIWVAYAEIDVPR